MEFLGIQPKETVEPSTKDLESSVKHGESISKLHGVVYITEDSDDEDNREDDQHRRWTKDRRICSGHTSYGSLPEYKLKEDRPTFNGSFKIEELLDWLYEVEAFFEFMDIPDDSKVKLVAYKLKGGDVAWWEKICQDRLNYHKPPVCTWTRMRKFIRDKFLPQDFRQQLFIKLQNCQQGDRSVEEYVAEFYNLVARNQIQDTEEQLVARFIEGLNRLIQYSMTQSAFTMVEAIQQAIKIEKRFSRPSKASQPRHPRYNNNYSTQ
ncbi:uncharacterized protein LOC113360113 [Papaver somniferum]|uniref:uncharacterized protein LOC113360113 n=1 Tax=Papaver somniferum TaxID=3469 RepID=UPI000E7043FB|nr:uncharacterized protein LOC113360113 [Papaver somniferum]